MALSISGYWQFTQTSRS